MSFENSSSYIVKSCLKTKIYKYMCVYLYLCVYVYTHIYSHCIYVYIFIWHARTCYLSLDLCVCVHVVYPWLFLKHLLISATAQRKCFEGISDLTFLLNSSIYGTIIF